MIFIVRDGNRFLSPGGKWIEFGGPDPIEFFRAREAADLAVATFGGRVQETEDPPEIARMPFGVNEGPR